MDSALVQVMAYRRTGEKPLSEPTLTHFTDAKGKRIHPGHTKTLSQLIAHVQDSQWVSFSWYPYDILDNLPQNTTVSLYVKIED